MKTISRRKALLGATAAVAVAGVPAATNAANLGNPDALLFALVEERGIQTHPARPRAGGNRSHDLADRTNRPDKPAREGQVPGGEARVWARAAPFPEEAVESLLVESRPRRIVALDGVTDVGNVGSIGRSAEAAGATGLILERRRSAPIGSGALRASAGALEYLRVARAPSLPRALDLARSEGLAVLAADPGGAPFAAVDRQLLAGEWIWVFGSEERGLRRGVVARADARVGIPLYGEIGSLGVAAAAAHLLLRTAEVWGREVSG